MSQLTHWNPFRAMSKAEPVSAFDDLFRQLGFRSAFRDVSTAPDIRIDVKEDDTSYRIHADIPGVKKEDIDVSIEGTTVSISAKTKKETERKGETEIYSERSEGQSYRSFTLPVEVDNAKAEANYADGVLTLLLPKSKNGSGRRIQIS